MKTLQTNQISIEQAIAQAPDSALQLAAMAARHRSQHLAIDKVETIRHWQADTGTYCYQTHISISRQPEQRLAWLVDVFFNAATLPKQPWYPQFLAGKSQQLNQPAGQGINRHQLTWGSFDVSLPAPRYYRQLVSLAQPNKQTAVIVARSTNDGPELPASSALAYTLNPNGEVLYWQNDCLHWHHICCTPGAAVLPGRLDRWLINSLRFLGLDQTERSTYQHEAEQLRDWLQVDNPELQLSNTQQ